MQFIDVLASAELREGAKRRVEVLGRAVAIIRVGGEVFAVDNACPHRDGELSQGDLQGHHLFCPLHAWCFDVRDGRGFFPKGAVITVFDVREEGGRVLVSAEGRRATPAGP